MVICDAVQNTNNVGLDFGAYSLVGKSLNWMTATQVLEGVEVHLVGLWADQDGRGGWLGLHDSLVRVAQLEGSRIVTLIALILCSADSCTSMFSMWKSTLEG